ncbi:hypothetical protein D9M69_706030 [compost metagenome]
MPQPNSGRTSIRAYNSTCEAFAANTCQVGRSAGSGGWRVVKRTSRRTITNSKIAIPNGLCNCSSHSWRSDTEATMPAPMNSMAMIITAISQCSSRANGAKWLD